MRTFAASGEHAFIDVLAAREEYRDRYLRQRDPIARDRILWRAQAFRQLVHLLPGQSILELGCGEGMLSRGLVTASRAENSITAVTFAQRIYRPADMPDTIRLLCTDSLPGALADKKFDFVVAMDLLDQRNCGWLLQKVYDLLTPGGQLVFFESNPWNPVLRLRRTCARLLGRRDPRSLLNRRQLYEVISDVGFIRVFSVFNDFLYAPLTPQLVWLLRNLSIVLENTPGLQTMAGSILIHAQKPPRSLPRPRVSFGAPGELRNAVSVVIPCHNEQENLRPLVTRLCEYYADYIHEIIPVDDNSSDATAEVIRALERENPLIKPVFRHLPAGVGRALADGYRATTGGYVLSMDCDFQHLLPELRDLFDAAAAGADVAVGSRFSRASVLLNYRFGKIVANRGFHLLARCVLLRRFRDLTNNLKLMRREVVERLQLLEPGFAANAETGLQPLVMGYNVKEVPISWIDRRADMGASSFRLAHAGTGYWRVLYRLWRRRVFGDGPYASLSRTAEWCSRERRTLATPSLRTGKPDPRRKATR